MFVVLRERQALCRTFYTHLTSCWRQKDKPSVADQIPVERSSWQRRWLGTLGEGGKREVKAILQHQKQCFRSRAVLRSRKLEKAANVTGQFLKFKFLI